VTLHNGRAATIAADSRAFESVVDIAAGPVLPYGQSFERDGVSCSMATSGVTCRSARGNGFMLSRERLDLFGPDLPQPPAPPPASGGSAGGGFYADPGSGHWISEVNDEIITLEDGSVWQVDSVDAIDSSLWLVLDDITVLEEGYLGYTLVNTDESESVNAEYLGG
jgi:hypothetical protein